MTESASDLSADVLERVGSIQTRLATTRATVAVAESTCGGLVSYLLSDAPDPAPWFRAGLIVYSNDAKRDLAGVPADTLAASGAVSRDAALALARGVRQRWGATWGIAETGIAGPIGQRRSRKPPGLVILAVVGGPLHSTGATVEVVEELVTGLDDRRANKRAFAAALLHLFDKVLARSASDAESGA